MPAISPYTLEQLAIWEKVLVSSLSGTATYGSGLQAASLVNHAVSTADLALEAWKKKQTELKGRA